MRNLEIVRNRAVTNFLRVKPGTLLGPPPEAYSETCQTSKLECFGEIPTNR